MFKDKYEAWASQQVQRPPEYVQKVLQIWHEEGALMEDDLFLNYIWWDEVNQKMVLKERR